MGLARYANRRDANEKDIVTALRQIGCTVIMQDDIDLLVGYRGKNFLLEVKMPKGVIEDSQVELLKTWRGQYNIVRSVEEAVAVVTEKK
jgi:hypothetical protein